MFSFFKKKPPVPDTPPSAPSEPLAPAPAPEPEQARWPTAVASAQVDSFAAADERTQALEPWPEQQWPESTSAVAETAGQVHAPTPESFEDLFPEIAPPEPLVSSFGMYDRLPPEQDAPLGEPGVGFAASGGGATDVVRDSAP